MRVNRSNFMILSWKTYKMNRFLRVTQSPKAENVEVESPAEYLQDMESEK